MATGIIINRPGHDALSHRLMQSEKVAMVSSMVRSKIVRGAVWESFTGYVYYRSSVRFLKTRGGKFEEQI